MQKDMPVGVGLAAAAHGGWQGAKFFFGRPRGQDLAGVVLGHEGIPHLRETLVRQAFRARMSRRRLAHSGSARRPRRSRRSQVTRRRTLVSASLAILTRWK